MIGIDAFEDTRVILRVPAETIPVKVSLVRVLFVKEVQKMFFTRRYQDTTTNNDTFNHSENGV